MNFYTQDEIALIRKTFPFNHYKEDKYRKPDFAAMFTDTSGICQYCNDEIEKNIKFHEMLCKNK